MPLPSFLQFLEPLFARPSADDAERLVGHLRIERFRDGQLAELAYEGPNYIVDGGLAAARDLLIGPNGGGFHGSIFRMAIGDGGCPAGQLFTPRLPDASWAARPDLFHEVLRQDVSVFSRPSSVAARFVGNFASIDVDPSSFSLPDRVINEAALLIGDGVLAVGGDKVQVHRTPPEVPDPDERLFSMRTFKSVSFDPAENVTVTITWTLSVIR